MAEQGYVMLVKPFGDDLARQVQRQVVTGYFRAKNAVAAPAERTRMEILQLAMESERARIEAETQRDAPELAWTRKGRGHDADGVVFRHPAKADES